VGTQEGEDAEVKILKAEVSSRPKNRERYRIFIKYKSHADSVEGLLGQACNCENGPRTIVVCAHVTCII